ncbi:hypothetical protein GGI05_002306, partial [Coemansia sp. RSA 2603]
MPKKFTGENSKGRHLRVVAAAKEKKAAAQAEKDSRQRAKKEEQEAAEWAKGAKTGGRKEDQEAKRLEKLAKKKEAERLLQEEEKQLAHAARAKTGPAKLHPTSKPTQPLRGAEKKAATREAAVAQREAAAQPVPEYEARSIDAALDLIDTLSIDDQAAPVDRAQAKTASLAAAIDRHPERRARAAYRAYEDREYERVRLENPGLRMTQIKEIVWKSWQKAPENPINQALVAHNADQEQVRQVVAEHKKAMHDRLRVDREQLEEMPLATPEPDLPDQYIAHASDLLTQTVFSALLGGTALLAFCLLRFRWPDVYAPRARLLYAAPARVGKTLLGWIRMTLEAKDYELMYSVGLDALLVLRLFKMLGTLAAAGSLVGLLAVVPLKVLLDAPAPGSTPRSLYDAVATAALGSERPLVVHFAFAYVFTALVYYCFSRFAYQAIALRWHYLLRVRNTRPARSVMVTGIPEELSTEHALKDHFERCGCGRVVAVEIVPRIERLGVVVRRRAHVLQLIEEQVTLVLGNPCTAAGYDRELLASLLNAHDTRASFADAQRLLRQWALPRYHTAGGEKRLNLVLGQLEHLLRRFHHADGVVGDVRRAWFGSFDGSRDRSSTVGFVTFVDAASAHLAAQAFTYAQPFQLRAELAPEPRDVFWDNVTLPLSSRMMRGIVSLAAYGVMIVYWFTMAFLLSTLVSMDTLKKLFPGQPLFSDENKWLKGLLRFTTPTFVLSLMNACVPYILSWLAGVSGIQSRSGIQRSVLQ